MHKIRKKNHFNFFSARSEIIGLKSGRLKFGFSLFSTTMIIHNSNESVRSKYLLIRTYADFNIFDLHDIHLAIINKQLRKSY